MLLAAARPVLRQTAAVTQSTPLLSIEGLTAGYGPVDAQGLPRSLVLHDITLTMQRGATLGVIGESGSGKSTLARVIAGLVAPARGTLQFNGEPLSPLLSGRTRDQFRRIQIVFQNADTALNPAHSVATILGRPLKFYHGMDGAARDKRIAQLLELVKLPVEMATRRCSELSVVKQHQSGARPGCRTRSDSVR
jgi:peptide/nickel transport system ATP-binding protein